MNVLILDDTKERHDAYGRMYSGHNVVHVYRYTQCIDELSRGGWDIVHLDHDLGDDVINADTVIDGRGRTRLLTGLDVVRWLGGCDDEMLPKRVIVHSVNPVGGADMSKELIARGIPTSWRPFKSLSV